jgi:phage terminase large subunit-like protein
MREDAKTHQLVLLPRDHQKSAMIAYRAAWEITRNPAVRILYISSTSNLANKQLKFIKDILTSDKYRFYWPEMVNADEGKREKWTETEISVDHPKRKAEFIRDPTIFTAGLTTAIVGMHCDIAIMDDVVTSQNGLTEEGREKTESQYSLLASIEASDAVEWIVGTRYHPRDLYGTLLEKKVSIFDQDGELVEETDLYEVFEKQVESIGDGTGEFLWPRQQRKDGKWFGFNRTILATKKAQYLDQVQFRAQYYNDPNSAEGNSIPRECFQYYDPRFLTRSGGYWYFKGKRLNVFAAMDFAYTIKQKSDYSAIIVVGVDEAHNYYVLDIDRFKTSIISEYFDHLLRLHQKWDFRKVKAEVTAAQSVIVEDIKINYVRKHGLALSIDEFKPSRYQGAKEERIAAVLQPRYANRQIWHYLGGNCQTLEEELMQAHPSHDDCKDALATCIDCCIAPAAQNYSPMINEYSKYTHSRFGGFA